MKNYLISFCLIIFCFIINFYCDAQSIYVDKQINEIVINKQYITIGYNSKYLIPNYVGEILVFPMTIGTTKRENTFHQELNLPSNFRTFSNQYNKTGYDRGHLAPAADFKFNRQAMYDSFSMANIAPQIPSLNRGNWQNLEDKIRKLSEGVDTLYVITGTIIGKNPKFISNNIAIPEAFYKAIIGKKKGKYTISCAWIYYNDKTLKIEKLTIDDLEKKINRNLFYKIKTVNIENKVLGIYF